MIRRLVTINSNGSSNQVAHYLHTEEEKENPRVILECQPYPNATILKFLFNAKQESSAKRALVSLVSEHLQPKWDAKAVMLMVHPSSSEVSFEISGPQHTQAALAISQALPNFPELTLEDQPDMITLRTVASVAKGQQQPTRSNVVSKVVASVAKEIAGVFEAANPQKGDRVIVNDGTGASPVYMVGTITQILPRDRRVSVLLDMGAKVSEQINNGPTGVIGFAQHQRANENPIDPRWLNRWLDPNRWMCLAASEILAQSSTR